MKWKVSSKETILLKTGLEGKNNVMKKENE
jgi:hypothetical protein